MEETALKPVPPHLGVSLTGPIRILVQTRTHLVPGKDFDERHLFMLDRICQHHWNRDFDPLIHRWSLHGGFYGYHDRPCYFLVDYGQSPNDDNDDVPILWYEWTGDSLEHLPGPLPPTIEAKLKKYPFTRPSREDIPKRPPLDPATRRKSIRTKLRSDMKPSESDFKFMMDPKEAKWLENNIEPQFWSKFESLAKSRYSQDVQSQDVQPSAPHENA